MLFDRGAFQLVQRGSLQYKSLPVLEDPCKRIFRLSSLPSIMSIPLLGLSRVVTAASSSLLS
jgi:hypothetical protein